MVPFASSQTITGTVTATVDPDLTIAGNAIKPIKNNGNVFKPVKKNVGNVYNIYVEQHKLVPEIEVKDEDEEEEKEKEEE